MHGRVISSRGVITVETPYAGSNSTHPHNYEYDRTKRPVAEDIREAVRDMLKETARHNRHVWWAKYPYTISIRPSDDTTRRGEYIWTATKR